MEEKSVTPPSTDFGQFFIKKSDYVFQQSMSFAWPVCFGPLRRSQPDVAELVRSSCKKLVDRAKYVEINTQFLGEYANRFCFDHIDNYQASINDFQYQLHSKSHLSERDIINMSCLFTIIQFGSGFTSMLQKFCAGHGVETIGHGLVNMYKQYQSFGVRSLALITVDDISEFFEIDCQTTPALASMCDMIYKALREIVHILTLKQFEDFADYVYHYIDLAWIKSQTKNLSAIKTIEWELNKQHEIGLILAPTRSKLVRRSVVIDFIPTSDEVNNAVCRDLVKCKGFLYAINDKVVYNKPFAEVISTIKGYLQSTNPNQWNPNEYTVGGKRVVALQFGMHLEREPETMQTLLFNFINDFSVLNDQYLYRGFYGPKKHLRIFLFQSVQSIAMELYYNVYVKAEPADRNPLFNFKGISSLTAVVDNVIPFLLLKDNVLKIKEEFADEFAKYINDGCILRTSELEVELIASAIWAVELMMTQRKHANDLNVAKLVYHLRNKGKMTEYNFYDRHHSRGTTSIN